MNVRGIKQLISIVLSALVLFLVYVAYSFYEITVVPLRTNSNTPVIIRLDKTASAHQFVRILKEKGVMRSTQFFLLMIRFEGLAHQLKAGVYQIKPGETAIQLLKRVTLGDVITLNFSIIAGTTQQKIAHDLSVAPYIDYHHDDWLSIKNSYLNAEGLVLADTYQYRGGSSSKTLLEQAHKNLLAYLNQNWENRASGLPYKTPYELLIAASVIEKETAVPSERKLISGVMVNRLKKYMPLQMDPTVIYGLGDQYKGKLSHNDLLIDTPYNSYRYRGLPPTPIATVGKEAIEAAAHPTFSNYLYFVAKGDGTHQFSETYEQQKRAINQYQRKGF